jgi:apolipoprotein N-acyltransferase
LKVFNRFSNYIVKQAMFFFDYGEKATIGIIMLISTFSGFILLVSWQPPHFFFLLFIAFVPLFFIIERNSILKKNPFLTWLTAYIAMFIWNLDNIWILYVDMAGGLIVLIVHPILLTLPFVILIFVRRKSYLIRYLLFITSWMFFERLLLRWQLAFPMLNLGNGLAANPKLIQWYEFIGVTGGACWILLVNILVYSLLLSIRSFNTNPIKPVYLTVCLSVAVLVPVGLSLIIYNNYLEKGPSVEVVGLDTRISCFFEKYTSTNEQMLASYLWHTKQILTKNTTCVIWPETALPKPIYLDELTNSTLIRIIKEDLCDYPSLRIITGIVLREKVLESPNGLDVRSDSATGLVYREYNAAMQVIPSSPEIEIKTKNRCVPGTEKLP